MNSIEQQLVDGIASENFLKAARRVYVENHDNRETVGQTVAALHNVGKIDVIAEFRKLNRSDQQHDFFMTRHVLEHALPSIDAPVTLVMACVKHLVEDAGNDMAAGTLIPPFIKFCEANAERAAEVLSVALADIDDTFDFITPAITAGSHLQLEQYANKAVELCSHENIKVRARSVHALGRITYHDRKDLVENSLQAIQTVIEHGCDEYLYVTALRSVFALYKADFNREDFAVKLTQHILQKPTDIILYEASQLLYFETEKLSASMVDILLQALIKTNPEHHGTIRNIDFGLYSLIKHRMLEKVIYFLEILLIQRENGFSVRQFETLSSALRNNKDRSLDILITRWLLSKQVALGRAAAELLDDHSNYGIVVAADLEQELPEGSRVFLARKACGWFFHKPISAVSFILSLIDSASDDEIQEITDILFNPLLISYSGCVKDYFVKIANNSHEKAKQVINDILEQLKKYHESLDSPIKELRPAQAQRETFHRYQSRLFAESYKTAQEDSILNLLATKMHILYGNSSVYYIHPNTESQNSRQEMALGKISHSFEFPSLENIDPHNLDYMLRVFRMEGCES